MGLSCKISQGEKVGIVGRTGAGKTTVINSLLRITDISKGDIFIDGNSILSYSLKDMRNSITMIDQ
jgi:ATP-binding cassette subfamily B multidrug efflux pump